MSYVSMQGLAWIFLLLLVRANSDFFDMKEMESAEYYEMDSASSNSLVLTPQTSSECWQVAINFLHEHDDRKNWPAARSKKDICRLMTDAQQKLLALQIASCQMEDVGRELFEPQGSCHERNRQRRHSYADYSDYEQDFDQEDEESEYDFWLKCLKQLTKDGFQSYTYYVSHVQILCVRLTQEVLLQHYQETQEDLLHQQFQSAQAAVEQWHTLEEWALKHQEQLLELSTAVPARLVQVLSQHVADWSETQLSELVEELQDEMATTLNRVVQDHVAEHEQVLQQLQQDIYQTQAHWQQTMSDQVQEQQRAWNTSTIEYQQQMEFHLKQHEKQARAVAGHLERLHDLLKAGEYVWDSTTATWIWIWEHIVAKSGPWIWCAVYSFWCNLIPWMVLTRSSARPTRFRILWLSLLGATTEATLLALQQYQSIGTDDQWLRTALGHSVHRSDIRKWTWMLQGILYVLSFLGWLLFGSWRKRNEDVRSTDLVQHETFREDYTDYLANRLVTYPRRYQTPSRSISEQEYFELSAPRRRFDRHDSMESEMEDEQDREEVAPNYLPPPRLYSSRESHPTYSRGRPRNQKNNPPRVERDSRVPTNANRNVVRNAHVPPRVSTQNYARSISRAPRPNYSRNEPTNAAISVPNQTSHNTLMVTPQEPFLPTLDRKRFAVEGDDDGDEETGQPARKRRCYANGDDNKDDEDYEDAMQDEMEAVPTRTKMKDYLDEEEEEDKDATSSTSTDNDDDDEDIDSMMEKGANKPLTANGNDMVVEEE